MHESSLHYFDTRDKGFNFFNTVSDNKEVFKTRHIKGVGFARGLYNTLIYPSDKDYKWVIRRNQTKKFPVTVQDVEVAYQVWVNNIESLKGKTTKIKLIVVSRDQVNIPLGLIKLHKEASSHEKYFHEQNPILPEAES